MNFKKKWIRTQEINCKLDIKITRQGNSKAANFHTDLGDSREQTLNQ